MNRTLVACVVALPVFAYIVVRGVVPVRRADAEIERLRVVAQAHHDDYAHAVSAISAVPVLAAAHGERDAGPFLQARLPWTPTDKDCRMGLEVYRGRTVEVAPPLVIDPALDARIGALRRPIWDHAEELDYSAIDFAWMTRLHDFDHWDLAASGPLAEIRPESSPLDCEPPMAPFYNWARLRLLAGLKAGDLPTAARDAHQLARLLLTTETGIGTVVATGILHAIVEASDAVGDGPRLPPELLVDDASREAARHVLSAGALYMHPYIDTPARALALAPATLVGCAALQDELLWVGAFRPVADAVAEEAFVRFDRVLAAPGPSRLSVARRTWGRLLLRDEDDLASELSPVLTERPTSLAWFYPALRRGIVGRVFSTVSSSAERVYPELRQPKSDAPGPE